MAASGKTLIGCGKGRRPADQRGVFRGPAERRPRAGCIRDHAQVEIPNQLGKKELVWRCPPERISALCPVTRAVPYILIFRLEETLCP
jgi:hypothetical protein